MQYINYYSSPFGEITIGSDGDALIGLWFNGGKYFGSTLGTDVPVKNLAVFDETKKWLDLYFSGKMPDFIPKISLNGSTFRLDVWEILKNIPYGKTMTYGGIARILALKYGREKMSAQAVGGAVGHNPIGIIIPCHRVIGTNGDLTGYAGGIDIKTKLLELEGIL